jgi:hypothetical protein
MVSRRIYELIDRGSKAVKLPSFLRVELLRACVGRKGKRNREKKLLKKVELTTDSTQGKRCKQPQNWRIPLRVDCVDSSVNSIILIRSLSVAQGSAGAETCVMTDRRRINGPPGGTRPPIFTSSIKPTATADAAERPQRQRQPNELRKICMVIIFLGPGDLNLHILSSS